MEKRIFGYARVSSKEQNLDRQLDALYRDKSFDMDAEITALETILAGEGLAKGSDFTDKDDDSQKIQLGM